MIGKCPSSRADLFLLDTNWAGEADDTTSFPIRSTLLISYANSQFSLMHQPLESLILALICYRVLMAPIYFLFYRPEEPMDASVGPFLLSGERLF